MKKCSKCGVEKEEGEFHKRGDGNGLRSDCKECYNSKSREYYNEHKEQHSDWAKQHRDKNKEKIKELSKKYYQEHKKERNEYKRQYRKNCKEEIKEKINKRRREHYKENKDRMNEIKRKRSKERYKTDIHFKFRLRITGAFNYWLKTNGGSKEGRSCMDFLPFTWEQFKEHVEEQFEPWMTWDNWGKYDPNRLTWQVDHIIPLDYYKCSSLNDPLIKEAWALSNLRPLLSIENIKKRNKIII